MSQIIARARVEAGLARAADLQEFFLVQSVQAFSESYILGSFVRTAMSIKSRTFKCVGINKGRL